MKNHYYIFYYFHFSPLIEPTIQLSLINLGAIWAGAADIPAFRSMRTLRALRPLRAVSRWEGMRVSIGLDLTIMTHTYTNRPTYTINLHRIFNCHFIVFNIVRNIVPWSCVCFTPNPRTVFNINTRQKNMHFVQIASVCKAENVDIDVLKPLFSQLFFFFFSFSFYFEILVSL